MKELITEINSLPEGFIFSGFVGGKDYQEAKERFEQIIQ
jgi:hypothetical protein